jgi:polyribonucleotide nucleotidyltransferase
MSEIFTTSFAGRDITVKTNYVAGQADGAVMVTYCETVVLVTAVSQKTKREGIDFLPLTVDYQEMTSAVGKIPGGFFKREGRPNENEILTSRLIDRAIRPLFPKGYSCETQLIATVLSFDPENGSDIAAMLGASATLIVSDIPFNGPIAGVRVGRIDGELICNPSNLEQSDINIFLVGRKVPDANAEGGFTVDLVMMEGGADEAAEDVIIEAINFGLASMRPVIEMQDEMRRVIGKEKRLIEPVTIDDDLRTKVYESAEEAMKTAFAIPAKKERDSAVQEIRDRVIHEISEEYEGQGFQVSSVLEELERKILRDTILEEHRRIDNRNFNEIRPISIETGVLPRTHGSALFKRGETQSLAILTLGTSHDEQRMDYISGEELRSFILHYNFPPYCVGESRPLRGPGRREIGHGALARRALLPLLPSQEEFPYTIRIVSEILSSNGSSSMATVCAGSLCLMDAGVPVRDIVAGIAMGLCKKNDRVVILSDILGDEDHAGDMDFKVCGTKKGITSLQMDIKIDGITEDILRKALYQAREGRIFIIDKITAAISEPRKELSKYAPRITTIKVKPEKIKDVIGSGGKNIRQIVSETGVEINVEDDGTVTIASNDAEASSRAISMVEWLTEEAEVGKVYMGTVKKIVDFGAFVEILPGTDGLVHISQLADERVNKVTDIINEGDQIPVKVIDIDRGGKIRLSRKDALKEYKQ